MATIAGSSGRTRVYMSGGSMPNSQVFQTKRKYSAAATPSVRCTHGKSIKRLSDIDRLPECRAKRRAAVGSRQRLRFAGT